MFQKLPKEEWREPKQGLLTILAHKFGKIDPMTPNAIFGLWVVLSMKWLLFNPRFEQTILKNFMLKSNEEYTKESLPLLRSGFE